MRARLTYRNTLQKRIEMGLISTRSRWKKAIEDADFAFPELSLDDLCTLFVATYKIKLARTYVEGYLDEQGDSIVELDDNNDDILHCTIQSRHSNATEYKCWIQYSLLNDPIIAWYYTCPARATTVGACSHVVAIVWYLSYARHHDFQPSKGRSRIQQAVMERVIDNEEDVDNVEDDNYED